MADNSIAYYLEKLYIMDKELGGKAKEGIFIFYIIF
jgi:hypothetical protein